MSGMYWSQAHPARRWLWIPFLVAAGLSVLFIATWFYYGPPASGYVAGAWPVFWFPFGFFIFIPIFFIGFFFLRWIFWGRWGWGWGWNRGYYADPAFEVLRERFARGEITKEQYEQMRRDLQW